MPMIRQFTLVVTILAFAVLCAGDARAAKKDVEPKKTAGVKKESGAEKTTAPPIPATDPLIETAYSRVTVADFMREAAENERAAGRPLTVEERRLLFQKLIDRVILSAEIRDQRLADRPDVRQRIEIMTESLLMRLLIAEKFGAELDVTDTEVARYYMDNRAQFVRPEMRDVYYIAVTTRREAEQVQDSAVKGKDFQAVLQPYIEKSQTTRDYFLESIARHQIVPEFADVVFALPAGYVSQPFQTRAGWLVAYVSKIVPPQQIPLAETHGDIRQFLFMKKGDDRLRLYLDELKLEKTVTVHGERFNRLLNQKPSKLMK